MAKKMVGTYRHRDAHGTSHDGIHDYNAFCDIEPRCEVYRELPPRLMRGNPDLPRYDNHYKDHDWVPACDEIPACQPKLLPDPEEAKEALKAKLQGTPYDPPPSHYDGKDGIDPWAIWKAFDLDPWEAALTKYILRSGKKEGESKLKDLKKARNYLAYLIEREEKRDG